jgi:hypothetical protein
MKKRQKRRPIPTHISAAELDADFRIFVPIDEPEVAKQVAEDIAKLVTNKWHVVHSMEPNDND